MLENKDRSKQEVPLLSTESSLKTTSDRLLDVLQDLSDSGRFYKEKDHPTISQAIQEIVSQTGGMVNEQGAINFSLESGPSDDLAGAEGLSTQLLVIEGKAIANIVNDNGEVSVEAGSDMDAWLKERVPRFAEEERRRQEEQERMKTMVEQAKQKANISDNSSEHLTRIREQAMDTAEADVVPASDLVSTQAPSRVDTKKMVANLEKIRERYLRYEARI